MRIKSGSIKSFHLPYLSGVEAVSGQQIINQFRRHIHKTYILGLVTQGNRRINHLGGTHQISENEIFIINPGQAHSCSSESPGHSYQIISVASQTMQSIASQISQKQEKRPYFKELQYENDVLRAKMIRLFEVIAAPESDIQAKRDLYSFLSYLIVNFSERPPLMDRMIKQEDAINRACDYIRQNFTKKLSLEKMAEIARLSPFHFQREFKKMVGITPHEYLSDFRISKSKKMLLNSEDIADIAVQLCFYDQSHFSRIFKKTVGVSPGKYAKLNTMRSSKPCA